MPREALSPPQAAAEISARQATLQHFLSLVLQPDVDKAALVSAIEIDRGLLMSMLCLNTKTISDVGQWHNDIDVEMMKAVAISLSSRAIVGGLREPSAEDWLASIKRSLVAASLAAHVDGVARGECRLVALLAGVDVRELGAAGCPGRVCDAIEFAQEKHEHLAGTSSLIRTVAVATSLVPFVEGATPIATPIIESGAALVGIEEDHIYEAIGKASQALERICAMLPSTSDPPNKNSCLGAMVANAGTGAAFYRALVRAGMSLPFELLVAQAGRHLFGATGACVFELNGDRLQARVGDDDIYVDASNAASELVNAIREGTPRVSSRSIDVVEVQLKRWLKSDAVLYMPMTNEQEGAVAFGVPLSMNEQLGQQKYLCSAMIEAMSDLKGKRGGQMIDSAMVKQKAREITHEVNNPLAIVQNYLRTMSLKLGDETPVQKEIDAISRELQRVSGLLHKYSQIGSAETLSVRATDLNALIKDLVALASAGDTRVTVSLRLDDSIPPFETAADALRQVVLNLLKNAIEALAATDAPRIEITTQGAVNLGGKHFVEIVISDNGPGMTQAQRLDLFVANTSTKSDERGLGLFIVKQLLDQMSGMISCRESHLDAGAGTSFQILVPFGLITTGAIDERYRD